MGKEICTHTEFCDLSIPVHFSVDLDVIRLHCNIIQIMYIYTEPKACKPWRSFDGFIFQAVFIFLHLLGGVKVWKNKTAFSEMI